MSRTLILAESLLPQRTRQGLQLPSSASNSVQVQRGKSAVEVQFGAGGRKQQLFETILDNRTAHLFAERLAPWLNAAPGVPRRSWQRIREEEVRALIWSDVRSGQLRPPGTTTAVGRRWLLQISEHWLLPRYDIVGATRLQWSINRAEGRSWMLAFLLALPIGASRIWAGSGIGYISTMLQGDTWQTLWWLLYDSPGRALLVGLGLPLLTVLYLAYEIQRRSRVAALSRALVLALKGEAFALLIGLAVTGLLGPYFLEQAVPAWSTSGWLLCVALYAQFALAIGIFTQLIFDGRRSSDPLDVDRILYEEQL